MSKICPSITERGEILDGTGAVTVFNLIRVFSTLGYPRIMQTDNGPEFAKIDMKNFVKERKIDFRTITPNHPERNDMFALLKISTVQGTHGRFAKLGHNYP
jgi:hypothetical protein